MDAREDTTPAVVLRTHPVGESDLVVVMLTATRGRVEARARGARKSRRRFPGGLPAGGRGIARIARGRGAMPRLEDFAPSSDHAALGRDLEAFAYAAYLCELVDQLVSGHTADPRIFAALVDALEASIQGPSPWVLRRFELRLLDGLGQLPALDACCVCGAERPEQGTIAFDPRRGGVLCERHAGSAERVPLQVLEAAEDLLQHGEAPTMLEDDARRALRDLCVGPIRARLRRPLRSLAFFKQLPRSPPSRPVDPSGGLE